MSRPKKIRLNLYLQKELVDFAKDWSYVTQKPISRMLEEYLQGQMKIVSGSTPFQWLSDRSLNPTLETDEAFLNDLVSYLNNREEEKFCQENPDHPRAAIRRKMVNEYEGKYLKLMEQRNSSEKELIRRWMKVFSSGYNKNNRRRENDRSDEE